MIPPKRRAEAANIPSAIFSSKRDVVENASLFLFMDKTCSNSLNHQNSRYKGKNTSKYLSGNLLAIAKHHKRHHEPFKCVYDDLALYFSNE